MIKLVAIDIDGTLVNEEKVVTPKVHQAIQTAIDQGVKIVLCTGRPMEGIRPYLEELGLQNEEDYVISHNGACITRTDSHEVLEEVALQLADLHELYEFGKNFPADICILNEEDFLLLVEDPQTASISKRMSDESDTVNMKLDLVTIDDLNEQSQLLKLLYVGAKEDLDVIEAAIPSEFRDRFYIVRSQDFLIEIMVKGTHKGTALEKLANHLGFTMDEVMAIGDGENDYEMIHAAGLGVVMANGTKRLLTIANQVTLSNEEDGVAHAFEKWVIR
ncbi:hypothetical protein BW721_05640 [Jeotgalibaca sp. PTS2502]|uniref:Cof-type HAD-IIB family hydrolase n=1 Tax=Jeotgalibaca sp. PTS2502 TaxID=1903686 RepID=UPI0009736659|nr:Cof-type HAD-IIB family hydrolase [Jeotgalibaca sp. PTS2502]APZ49201.1 hypothetical protein BW721_05640 [Jeotgalibaca sp. PTS2502]